MNPLPPISIVSVLNCLLSVISQSGKCHTSQKNFSHFWKEKVLFLISFFLLDSRVLIGVRIREREKKKKEVTNTWFSRVIYTHSDEGYEHHFDIGSVIYHRVSLSPAARNK